MAWTGDWCGRHGGLEISVDGLEISLTLILSFSLTLILSLSLTPILSLILHMGFGFALIICYRYRCIYKFMVVAVGGCCGGGRIGSLWVGIGQGLGQIWWVCGCFGGGKDF